MDTGQIVGKIARLRAAIGMAADPDFQKFKPTMVRTKDRVGFVYNFSGGLTQAQIENLAWDVIRAISDLKDHLRKWAHANGRSKDAVDDAVKSSRELSIVHGC
jgi:hypothetical protein